MQGALSSHESLFLKQGSCSQGTADKSLAATLLVGFVSVLRRSLVVPAQSASNEHRYRSCFSQVWRHVLCGVDECLPDIHSHLYCTETHIRIYCAKTAADRPRAKSDNGDLRPVLEQRPCRHRARARDCGDGHLGSTRSHTCPWIRQPSPQRRCQESTSHDAFHASRQHRPCDHLGTNEMLL